MKLFYCLGEKNGKLRFDECLSTPENRYGQLNAASRRRMRGRHSKPEVVRELGDERDDVRWPPVGSSGLDACYELVKMIAGAGVGMAGGHGLGMLRARRRDISVKPNRKLDRKSSRGMIYENEELRLRTIHINAEVEQGQNDIKKLRRENEQLRREIWSLRDEYDKLEEILKKQKSREESDEPENRSGDEIGDSEYSDNEDEEEDEEEGDEESLSEEEAAEEVDQEEQLENAENQKISSEKLSNGTSTQYRARVNFDGLPVVQEEDETKKDARDKKENEAPGEQSSRMDAVKQLTSTQQQNHFQYAANSQADSLSATSFGYQTDCPFVFPSSAEASGYSNIGNCLLMTTRPQMYGSSQQPVIPLNSSHDISAHNHSHPTLVANATPPPPAGWQSSVSMLPAVGGSPIVASNFPLVARTQSPSCDSCLPSSKDLALKLPEAVENSQSIGSSPHPRLTSAQSLSERKRAFFRQHMDSFHASGPRNSDNNGVLDATANAQGSIDFDGKNRTERSIDDRGPVGGEAATPEASTPIDNRPRHFFAPLAIRTKFSDSDESAVRSMNDNGAARNSDNGNSPSSEKTTSTVISRNRYNYEKGAIDVCVNGAVSCSAETHIEKGDAKAFFSSENLLEVDDVHRNGSSNGSNSPLMKSVSCQDLSSRLSFTENLKTAGNDHQYARSDNTLDNISLLSTKAFKSQLNVTLRQPKNRKSQSPDTPEIPKLPSIDYKLFNNPFLQDFEQSYQNFPIRTEGQSPVTHPLSIQVCESPVAGMSYSSPVRVQSSFSGPNIAEPDCGACKRKDLDRLRLLIPPPKLNGEKQPEYHVTSFENPSPHTLQIPPMTPYELEALRRMPTGTSPINQTPRLYQNVPFVPGGAAVYCPGQGMRMYYDTASMKVPAQTQTSLEDQPTTPKAEDEAKAAAASTGSNQPTPDQPKKRRSRKEKSGSVKEKRRSPSTQRRKDQLKKQSSVTSKDAPESPGKASAKTRAGEAEDEKNESRSSSSGQDSPRKDQTKRVSLYFNAKKRPSLSSSVRTSRSRSVENAREKQLARGESEANNSERERTNSVSSREATAREKSRKMSTGSGSVPWCACWGNGCI